MIVNDFSMDIEPRQSIESIYALKLRLMEKLNAVKELETDIQDSFKVIDGYPPIRIDYDYGRHNADSMEKYIDRTCWRYLVLLFNLGKYMLCTD